MKARRFIPLVIVVALLVNLVCSPTVLARIILPKLSDLIQKADRIVLGKVTNISVIGEIQVAKLRVERVLKGDQGIAEIYFRATPTWACDISHAETNESGLYYFNRGRVLNPKNTAAKKSPRSEHPERILQGQPLYSITWDGYGRFVNEEQGKLSASVGVEFPESVRVKYVRRGKYHHVALVNPDDVFRLIHLNNKYKKSG
jgi:hypothetical protein